jgi:hypothetical protein
MLGKRQTTHPRMTVRSAGAIVATAAALGGFASFAAPGLATNTIKVAVGETAIIVNGSTISTSNLTISQLAQLQGVPASTVQLELDGVAVNTPAASAVKALVAGLPLQTTLAAVFDAIYKATGGAVTPQAALRQVIEDEGTPGASGANGGNGAGGAAGANGSGTPAGGSPTGGSTPAKKRLSLSATSRSLKGRPGSRVRVRFSVSAAAKLSYSGRKLAKGSRAVKSGANVLMVKLPRKHGTYMLVLRAVGADGQSAQTTVALHDVAAKKAKKGHR